MKDLMKAGNYYIGDLCYVLGDYWEEFCALTIEGHNCKDGKFQFKDGTEFTTYKTMYGDGTYLDQFGRAYCVDAGLIGCVLVSDIKSVSGDVAKVLESAKDLGNFIDFKEDFKCYSENGQIYFGNIQIDTVYEEEPEEDEEEDY